ncbi:MAG TPA: YidB family protein [Chlorobaculum sp.]|jgi:uncharacterized protein YidB (DUF937 family)|nr:YidB family protein [Chlorobaculum sp.]
MDITNILQLGASAIKQSGDPAISGLGTDQLTSALGNLFKGEDGHLDFGSLIAKMQAGGMGDIVTSWLGHGEKVPISPEAITNLIGADKVTAFASQLGLSDQNAKSAIADALPVMVEKAAPSGSIVENLVEKAGEGLKGVKDAIGKLF